MIDLNERMNRLPPEAKQIVRDWIDANKREYIALKQYCRELETRVRELADAHHDEIETRTKNTELQSRIEKLEAWVAFVGRYQPDVAEEAYREIRNVSHIR